MGDLEFNIGDIVESITSRYKYKIIKIVNPPVQSNTYILRNEEGYTVPVSRNFLLAHYKKVEFYTPEYDAIQTWLNTKS